MTTDLPIESPTTATLVEEAGRKLGVRNIHTEADLARLVERGLRVRALDTLLRHGITQADLFRSVIPRRTLAHRRSRSEPLSSDESARAVRLARLTALAERVFGDPEKAQRWLRKPQDRLEGQAPIDALGNEVWARVVEDTLQQIDHGIFA